MRSDKRRVQDHSWNRRQFLATSGAAIAGAAVPSGAVGASQPARSYRRVIGANDRIRIGVIGCGGMGTSHIRHYTGNDGAFADRTNTEITAVCDVFEPHKERAEEMSGAPVFHDYRELIDSGLVDAVIIASPEHWHYRQTVDAARAGLHIYLQKAMTRNYEEAKSLYEVITASDVVFQLGSQYAQVPGCWRAREILAEGGIGKITICQTSYCRNSADGEWNREHRFDAEPGRNLDWYAWLGELPYVEFDPDYFWNYRKYRPFSAGIITDLMPHKIHTISYVVGPEFPKRVTAVGNHYVHPDRDVADTVLVTVEFSDYTMLVMGSTANELGLEDLIRGHEGNLYIGNSSVRKSPERVYAEFVDPIDEQLNPANMNPHLIHQEEWINAIRGEGECMWSIEPSFKVMTTIALAERAYWEQRTVCFDEETRTIT